MKKTIPYQGMIFFHNAPLKKNLGGGISPLIHKKFTVVGTYWNNSLERYFLGFSRGGVFSMIICKFSKNGSYQGVFFFSRENFWISKMAVKIFRFWNFSRVIWSFFKFFYYKNPKLPVEFFEKGGRESQKYSWKWWNSIFFTGGENFHRKKHCGGSM